MNRIDSPFATTPATTEPTVQPAQDIDAAQRSKIEKAAVQFEGLFIHQMLKQMRRSTDQIGGEDALFKGQSDNGLLDLADTMLADVMAGQRAFGIADTIVRQMLPPAGVPVASASPAAAAAAVTETAFKSVVPPVALPMDRRTEAPLSSTVDQPDPLP